MAMLSPMDFLAQSDAELAVKTDAAGRKVRMKAELTRLGKISNDGIIQAACLHVGALSGIYLESGQLQEILALYPAEKARLVRYTSSDIAHAELATKGEGTASAYLVANVMAHFFGNTQWPEPGSNVDRQAFAKRLRRAAHLQGYTITPPLAHAV